jgi:hypothetical protein
MSITITQDYDNYAACIGSGQQIYVYSSNYNEPNFYVSLAVQDGLGFNRTYYLYPNPVNHRCYFNLDLLLDSFFKAPFLLNNYTQFINILDTTSIYSNIREFRLTATAYWTGGSENTTLNLIGIYNADKMLDYFVDNQGISGIYGLENNIFPFINNKIYIHSGCKVLFSAYDVQNNVFIGIYDINNNELFKFNQDNTQKFANYDYFDFTSYTYLRLTHQVGEIYYNIVDTSCKKSGIMVYFWTTKGTIESYYFPSYTEVLSGVQRNVIKTNKGWTTGTNYIYSIYSDYNSFGGTYTRQIQITSDLLDDDDAKALSYLLTSPYIFFKFCDIGMDNVYFNAVVKDTNYDITSYKRNKYTTKQFILDYKELKI